jgi:glycosyltransferase involved in cell wall biosynthesis
MMFLSVIIPTRNRANCLKNALDSILNQDFHSDDNEIIVVDNASTDETKEVVESFCKRYNKNVRYFYEEEPGLHNGRHRGAKEALGSILAYIDDDVIVSETWLEGIQESFVNSKVGIVTGNILPFFVERPPKWLNAYWQKLPEGEALGWLSLFHGGDTKRYIESDYVCGCNFAIKKELLLRCKGFHPDSMPAELIKYRGDGETALVRKIRALDYKILFNPKLSIFHVIDKHRLKVKYLYKRAFLQGISYSYIQVRVRKNRFLIIPSFFLRMLRIYFSLIIDFKHLHPTKIILWLYYAGGFFYHQKHIFFDKNMLSWVLKDSYMNL